jgi:hypothetical protein
MPYGSITLKSAVDQLAKFERAKTAERTRRGKLRKAREGKVLAGPRPPYGFRYNDARDNYVVDEETMRVIKRIFRMVGGEGHTMHAVRLAFNQEVATDQRAPAAIAPIAVGFALAVGVFIAGPVTGGSVNPARSLGPMLVAGDFTSVWLYILGPIIGGVLAALLYDRFLAQTEGPG